MRAQEVTILGSSTTCSASQIIKKKKKKRVHVCETKEKQEKKKNQIYLGKCFWVLQVQLGRVVLSRVSGDHK